MASSKNILLGSLFFLILGNPFGYAQKGKINYYDTTFIVEDSRSLKWLNDTLFKALVENEYVFIQGLVPSFGVFDSFLKLKNPELNFTSRKIKYAQVIGKVKSQHKKFRKKIKKSDFFLRNSTLDSTSFGDYDLNDSIPYCEVIMYCSRKNKEFKIKYYSIFILGNWYLFDKLYFYNLADKKKQTTN